MKTVITGMRLETLRKHVRAANGLAGSVELGNAVVQSGALRHIKPGHYQTSATRVLGTLIVDDLPNDYLRSISAPEPEHLVTGGLI